MKQMTINHPVDIEDRVARIIRGAHDHEMPTVEELAAWASRLVDDDLDEMFSLICAERRWRKEK